MAHGSVKQLIIKEEIEICNLDIVQFFLYRNCELRGHAFNF